MAVIKTVRFFFPKKIKAVPKVVPNPYIQHQVIKKTNDRWYKEYTDWMQRNDPEGMPASKIMYEEDVNRDKKIRGLF